MSFTTNKPAEGATPPAVMLRTAGRAPVRLSGAQVARSLRLHPWLALAVGCLAAGGLAGYALSPRAQGQASLALLAAALPLGVLLGVLAAVLRRRQDSRIYAEGEIQELIGLPPLAILPARGEVASGAYEAHLLRLAGAIAGARRTRAAKAFLLTPVNPRTDIEPLVSALCRKFEATGFSIAVASVDDLLQPVAEVHTGGFVAANLARLTSEERLLLIEGRALLESAETEYVAHCVDATILVVECGVTTRQELWRAAGQLERMQVTGVGAVLEELPMRLAEPHYRATIEAAETGRVSRSIPPRPFVPASDLVQDEGPAVAEQPVPPAAPLGPSLVNLAVESRVQPEEKPAERSFDRPEARIPHEKIAPGVSGPRQAPASDGELGMTRRMGWLERLLGRGAEPASILPTDDDDDEDKSLAAQVPAPAEDDYSAPLATRLDQISRQRPAAPASATKASTRLQIVPQEAPREIVVPFSGARELSAPEYPSVAALGATIPLGEAATSEAATSEAARPAEAMPEASTPEVPALEAAALEEPEPEELEPEHPEPEPNPMDAPYEAPMTTARQELLAQQEWEWESGQALNPEAPAESEVLAAPAEDRARPSGPHSGYEVLAFVPEVRTPSEVAWRSHWGEPAEAAIPAAEAELPTLPEAPVEAPQPAAAEGDAAAYDADDIEPVYEEVSRHLTLSRWDPIPTLRPDSTGWRDRPSPMPPSNPGVERRWTGEDQDLDAWRSGPPSGSGPRMDSLPEPMLTRQWGLLSKFQQARISSGSRPAARTEEDEPVGNGNGKH